MTARTRWGIALAFVLSALLWIVAGRAQETAAGGQSGTSELTFPVMGTVASFTFHGPPEAARAAAGAGRAEFDRVVRLCSLFDPESELVRLNAAAAEQPFVCSPELWELLREARRAWEFSDGAFDVTAKPLMDLWGFYRRRGNRLPEAEELAQARRKVGLDKVVFDDSLRTVKFTVPGMSIDLGGIAKGYAVDLAAAAALKCGIRSGVIDLGGNLRLLPAPPPGSSSYRIGIKDPSDSARLLPEVLELCNVALSTSGDYERYVIINGVRYGHIMDPAAGLPTQGDYSVTVIAPDAMSADWLSTAIFIRGESLARRAESELPGVKVRIVRPQNDSSNQCDTRSM